jgi:Alpha-glutamyl/putrescinyl thymine pyrophosphorylase clade 3
MKWPKRQTRKQQISTLLLQHSQATRPLPGIDDPDAREALAMQIVASIRREDYFRVIQNRGPIGGDRANPNSDSFDAELGVVHLLQQNAIDEAAWLLFLMVYLAKPVDSGWRRLRDIYGRLGNGVWNWQAVTADPDAFEQWLAANWQAIGGKFGNHRKYESLRPNASRPMGPSIVTYVQWVNSVGGHQKLFSQIVLNAGNDPHTIFDAFYHSLPVKGFGRLGRFDWVSMLSRYQFIPAEAGSAYLDTATGPKSGIRLLFTGDARAGSQPSILQRWLDDLDADLGVGMEVLEDSICNWQKRPTRFQHFKG